MDYPSTTQALFALVVMMIVLAFILVYCCWGTFTCHVPEENLRFHHEERLTPTAEGENTPVGSRALVILPYHNMIYIGDSRTHRILQIPIINEDKPPNYNQLFANNCQPPDYNSTTQSADEIPPPNYEESMANLKGSAGSSRKSFCQSASNEKLSKEENAGLIKLMNTNMSFSNSSDLLRNITVISSQDLHHPITSNNSESASSSKASCQPCGKPSTSHIVESNHSSPSDLNSQTYESSEHISGAKENR